MRKAARILALVLVAISSVTGLINIPGELRDLGPTFLQRSVAIGSALHSILGAILLLAMLRRRPWGVAVATAWTIAVVYTASVASVAWEAERDAAVLMGAAVAGISCALVGWLVVWAARESATRHIPTTSDSPPNR